jgi:tetratricopeptide (TPR) repeat protein
MTDTEIEATLAQARELRKAGDDQEAIELLTEAIRTTPNAQLYYLRGIMFDMSERVEEAISDYTEAIELDPAKAAYYFDRGFVLSYPLGRDEEAIADFETGLEIEPDNVYAHRSCCLSYLLVGPAEVALSHAEAAVRLAPDDALSHFCLGQSYFSLDRNTDALDAFLKAVEFDPEDANNWSALAIAYRHVDAEGGQELALAAITKAIELDPNSVGYFRSRGSLLLKMGQTQEATADFRHALTLNPDEVTRMLIDSYLEQAMGSLQRRE